MFIRNFSNQITYRKRQLKSIQLQSNGFVKSEIHSKIEQTNFGQINNDQSIPPSLIEEVSFYNHIFIYIYIPAHARLLFKLLSLKPKYIKLHSILFFLYIAVCIKD